MCIDIDEKAGDQDEAKQVAVSARSLAEGRVRSADCRAQRGRSDVEGKGMLIGGVGFVHDPRYESWDNTKAAKIASTFVDLVTTRGVTAD